MVEERIQTDVEIKCFHCGEMGEMPFSLGERFFCCLGCKTVYEILEANTLCQYYSLDNNPGLSQKKNQSHDFAYLDNADIRKKIISFDSENLTRVTFSVPSIHCVSCIWLLENLRKIQNGIYTSQVNFPGKRVDIDFDPKKIKLSQVANLLARIGYTPTISLDQQQQKKSSPGAKSVVLKLSIAGFCFGNVMLFSFPEYLGLDHHDLYLARVFSWLNVALSIPVFFYSGYGYIRAAFNSFKQRQINIDVPIAAGLIALFSRSLYDILTATGPGYLDSFTGLVFFLLIGRWFQNKTYERLAFDRDYTSYFPLAVNRLVNKVWQPVVIYDLNPGDSIRIRNMEIVPADSILLDEEALIDYSFVTGESKGVKVADGDLVYAGGRLIGAPAHLIVEKNVSQSHLTSLWNGDVNKKRNTSSYQKKIDQAARVFTWVVMFIAMATAVYWYFENPSRMWLVLTSVLMVACPCALALAAPFTYGSMLRVFGRHHLYLKNADVIERMARVNAVVFDKTGTVTHGQEPKIEFNGVLSDETIGMVKIITSFSTHPLSVLISKSIQSSVAAHVEVIGFMEIPGKGLKATIDGQQIKIGSAKFVNDSTTHHSGATKVFVSINQIVCGYFSIQTSVRKNMKDMLMRLGKKCSALISGDTDADRIEMEKLFPKNTSLLFLQSPHDKLSYIENLQRQHSVLMVGDGLNDAGALRQSDVGFAVTDDTGIFTPACDGILYGENLNILDKYMELAQSSTYILRTAFAISFIYNAVAVGFAATGNLTPLVAAILMPLSSISVVSFASLAVNFIGKRKLQSNNTMS